MIFTNNFITTLLGISPMKLGKKKFFPLGLVPIFSPKNAVGKSLGAMFYVRHIDFSY
jgi:hypothetical protein